MPLPLRPMHCLATLTALMSALPTAHAAWPDTPPTLIVTGQKDEKPGHWIKAEAVNVIVYATDERQARETAARLERFHQVLTLLTRSSPHPDSRAIPVYLVRSRNEIGRLRRQGMTPGSFPTGYYSASPTGMLLAADLEWDLLYPRTPSVSDVWLFEEYTRHFIARNEQSGNLPDWYVTGFALVMATMQFHKDRIDYGLGHPDLVRRLQSARWEPMEHIIGGRLEHGQMYSAQAMLLVHYILARPDRQAAFKRFIAALHRGQPPIPAFEQTFNTTMATLQTSLQDYRGRAGHTGATLTGFTTPEVFVSRLPLSADTLMLDDAAMRIGIPEEDRQRAVLQRARNAYDGTHDHFAARALIRAQLLYGEPALADPALDRLMAARPRDAELLYLKGLRHLMAGTRGAPSLAPDEWRKAQQWLIQAHHLDEDDYAILYAWVASLGADPQFLSDNALNALLRAAYLAPQATQIRISATLMMMAREQFDDAIALLSSITATPRDPASTQVPALLEQARAHRKPDLAAIIASFRYTATWRDLNCC